MVNHSSVDSVSGSTEGSIFYDEQTFCLHTFSIKLYPGISEFDPGMRCKLDFHLGNIISARQNRHMHPLSCTEFDYER